MKYASFSDFIHIGKDSYEKLMGNLEGGRYGMSLKKNLTWSAYQ